MAVPQDFAITLRGMGVADGKERALDFDRQVKRDASGEVSDVHIAADAPRRDDGMQTWLSRRHADRAGKGLQRYLAAWAIGSRRHAGRVIGPDMQRRILELVGKQAEARNVGGPAMAGRMKLADRDLQRVARLGSFNEDWSGNRIDLAEIKIGERFKRRVAADLAAGGIHAFEQDRFTGLCCQGRRKIAVPAEIVLSAVDGVVAGDAHGMAPDVQLVFVG